MQVHVNDIESYWSEFGFRNIPDCMARNKFEAIKKYLSFNDESKRIPRGQLGYDPIFRLRKLSTHFNERFNSKKCSFVHRRTNVFHQNDSSLTSVFTRQAASMRSKVFLFFATVKATRTDLKLILELRMMILFCLVHKILDQLVT